MLSGKLCLKDFGFGNRKAWRQFLALAWVGCSPVHQFCSDVRLNLDGNIQLEKAASLIKLSKLQTWNISAAFKKNSSTSGTWILYNQKQSSIKEYFTNFFTHILHLSHCIQYLLLSNTSQSTWRKSDRKPQISF